MGVNNTGWSSSVNTFLIQQIIEFYFFILDNLQIDQEHEFSTSQASILVDILGEENMRRLSAVSNHVQTTSSSNQCFFCLLLLVLFILFIGILTSVILLTFLVWMFQQEINSISVSQIQRKYFCFIEICQCQHSSSTSTLPTCFGTFSIMPTASTPVLKSIFIFWSCKPLHIQVYKKVH